MTKVYVPSKETIDVVCSASPRHKKIDGIVYHFYTAYFRDGRLGWELAHEMAQHIRARGFRAKVIEDKNNHNKALEMWVSRK